MARSNFPAALKELLIHEGGYAFVRPFAVCLANKQCYRGACQTTNLLPQPSARRFPPKARRSTKPTPLKILEATPALSTGAPTTPTLSACATRITSENAPGRIFPRHSADARTALPAARAVTRSTAKAAGVCAPSTTANSVVRSCGRSVWTSSEAAASAAAGRTLWSRTISTTTTHQGKTSRYHPPSRARVSRPSLTRSLSAPCFALIATG